MNKLIELKEQADEKVDSLSLRERVLIALTFCALIYFAWENIVFKKVWSSKDDLVTQVDSASKQIQSVKGQIQAVTTKIQTNNYDELQKQVLSLKARNQEMRTLIEKMAEQLLPPSEMSNMLSHMLKSDSGIRIINMSNIPETPLFTGLSEEDVNNDPNKIQVYQHGMELIIEGEYFSIMNFLKELESIPWRLIWSSLDYEVVEYPVGRVKITLYTLSLHQGWIST